ncbi:hypothetical protein KDK_35980 [Dictyobacter kobayashii]|uniref:Uncharacterized protein n=1 Tax=Dictyobacter kobayashii TaxID=2014872 RepID=A0A402AKP2_9CHLR|nr:hypothetical protein KDK_35980 [Dictyobacter kobayashii]
MSILSGVEYMWWAAAAAHHIYSTPGAAGAKEEHEKPWHQIESIRHLVIKQKVKRGVKRPENAPETGDILYFIH